MRGNVRMSVMEAVSSIWRVSQLYISDKAKKFSVGRGQWYVLNRLLFDNDGLTNKELADDLFVDKANITRAVKKLESEGYVYHKCSEEDLRKINIYVTDKAEAMCEEYHKVFMDLNDVLLKGFSEEEKVMAREFVYRMSDNITDYMNDRK